MIQRQRSKTTGSVHRTLRGTAIAAAAMLSLAPAAYADGPDPKAVLKSMSDYLGKQTSIAANLDTSIEVITPTLEKIQFASSSVLNVKRPDKLKLERMSGNAAIELLYDGTTLTIRDVNDKTYAQEKAPGTLDALVDHMRGDFGVSAPGADLLLSDVYGALSPDVLSAKYIGTGVIDGISCDHLAFRNAETDWQLWVRQGNEPIPCKMIITSKTMASGPQYTIEFRNWETGKALDDSVFSFQPDAGESKVAFKQLSGLDEVPPGSAPQGEE